MAAAQQPNLKNSWTSSIDKSGAYKRKESSFRHSIGDADFPAEANRYHLYVSYACPWACRCLTVRALKGLEKVITVTVVDWHLGPDGWIFCDDKPGCSLDPVNGFKLMREVYKKANPEYEGNITVPCLFDTKTQRIVNNESSEIIRMFNHVFNDLCATDEHKALDFYPENLREKIDAVNAWVYPNINNGVYKCGFARTQQAYDVAFDSLFEHLDKAEEILSKSRYLTGDVLTEADIRLFVTLIRFDVCYVQHFKTNLRRIRDYPNLDAHTRELYQMPGVRSTVNLQHIKHHYMGSHKSINPLGIIPKGPDGSWLEQPHGRDAQ